MARVQDQGTESDAITVSHDTKQGCVMAPMLFSIILSIMLQDAFRDNDLGIYIQFRTNGNIFNLQHLKAKTKTTELLVRDLLFDDDCAIIAYSIGFGLTISLMETEVMFQPKPGTNNIPPNITINNVPLNVVDKFTYLESTLSENSMDPIQTTRYQISDD